MAPRIIRNFPFALWPILLFALIAASVAGANVSMSSAADGYMTSCPFIVSAAPCQMNIAEHLHSWRNVFGVPFPSGFPINALAILVLPAVLFSMPWSLHSPEIQATALLGQHPGTRLFNYFVLLFSRGLLHRRSIPPTAASFA